MKWQEHCFDHRQDLTRVFFNDQVAIYFDNDVDKSIKWPNQYFTDAWRYVKSVYGNFGSDERLYAIFHANKYGGGHPHTQFDQSGDFRNVVDCGKSGDNVWSAGAENDLDMPTHEISHIVEGSAHGVQESPAFEIWGDSKWAEIFIYDVYQGLGRKGDAERWYNMMIDGEDNFPRPGTHWFRDWFYPIYRMNGPRMGSFTLNKFFLLLSKNFPKNGQTYSRRMNMGEFVHFWSGATGTNLKEMATRAFGWTADWENQLNQAKKDFPNLPYDQEILFYENINQQECSNGLLSTNFNDKAKSINTNGQCIRVFNDKDCKGESKTFSADPRNECVHADFSKSAELIRKQKLTSTKLISAYISRIKIVNPIINAVVEENFDGALKEAKKIDDYLVQLDKNSEEYKSLSKTKPLLGIPFTIKDTLAVKGFHLTAGIIARKDFIAEFDSDVVQNVKEAGAILLARTNVPESARHVESNNQLFGRTNNPYDSRRTPGGSSGGEGALIASSGSIFGIGSDLAGSIRVPAAFNGIFGLKPSEGSISLKGHYPSFSKGYPVKMCYVGPLCRYAKDLSLLFRIMVGGNEKIAEKRFQFSKNISMKNIRFFYTNGLNSTMIENFDAKKSMHKCINYFEEKYGNSVDEIHFDQMQYVMGMYYSSLTETKEGKFSHVLKQAEEDINIGTEFIRKLFNKSDHTVSSLIVMAQDNFISFEPENRKFLENARDKLRQEIIELLNDDGILIFPAWPTLPPFHNHLLLAFWNKMYTGIWNVLRLPAIVCPLGLNENGLPLSVQLIAAPDNDQLLIEAANDLEDGFGGWQSPSK
uniref:Amidase domain-containing protein n=1 Tax=Panagrolaimus sp. ES5 TaxID=591445 RepID=A0AC34FKX3_9BILA